MLDNLTGSDTTSTFGGISEQKPTESTSEAVTKDDANAEPTPATSQGESDKGADNVDTRNKFVKYDYDDESKKYRFKSNGKEVELTVEDLISSRQGEDNIQEKMQALAKERKGVFAEAKQKELESLKQEKERYTQLIRDIEDLQPKEDDEELESLLDTDPGEYIRRKEQKEKRQQALKKAKEDAAKATEERRQKLLESEVSELKKKLDLGEKELSEAVGTMRTYVSEMGISDDEMAGLVDHRFWLIVNDAAKYQALKNKEFEAEKPTPTKTSSGRAPKPANSERVPTSELFYGKG